jgi:hypothetical protein
VWQRTKTAEKYDEKKYHKILEKASKKESKKAKKESKKTDHHGADRQISFARDLGGNKRKRGEEAMNTPGIKASADETDRSAGRQWISWCFRYVPTVGLLRKQIRLRHTLFPYASN